MKEGSLALFHSVSFVVSTPSSPAQSLPHPTVDHTHPLPLLPVMELTSPRNSWEVGSVILHTEEPNKGSFSYQDLPLLRAVEIISPIYFSMFKLKTRDVLPPEIRVRAFDISPVA